MRPWLSVEFHCHSLCSCDSLSSLEKLINTAERRGIDRLAITDHNRIVGAVAAQKLAPERIIVGEEIRTQKGELLAFYVQEEIPKGLPVQEAIRRLKEQGAFISVSHPFDIGREHWSVKDLLEIIPLVDAIEIFNGRCFSPLANEQAKRFAQKHGLAGTAGSDAHLLMEVGQTRMRLPWFENNAVGLREVIFLGVVEGRMSKPWAHWGSWWARMVKMMRNRECP